MAETTSREEIALLRSDLREMVTVDRFQRHEDLDKERHDAADARLGKIERSQENLAGRLAIAAAILVLAIPVITSWLVTASSHGKP